MVISGWEHQTFNLKALLSGIQMGALSVIQTGQEGSQTTIGEMKIASQCGSTMVGGMMEFVKIHHCTLSVNKLFIALED